MSNPSFAIKLDTSRKLKDGSHPIVLQVIYLRKVHRLRVGLSALPREWRNDRFKKVLPNAKEKNERLSSLEEKADTIYYKHFLQKEFDYKQFTTLFKQGDVKDFFILLDEYVEKKRNEKAKIGTIIYYDETIRSAVQRFSQEVKVSQIDKDWLQKFAYRYNSSAYMRGLKAVMTYAMERQYIEVKDYPFKASYNPTGFDYSFIKKSKRKEPEIAYTEEEIGKWINYQPTKREQRAYDAFMQSYYLFGANMWDFMQFTDNNIRGNDLTFVREKTGVIVSLPLTDYIKRGFKKYRKGKYLYYLVEPTLEEREKRRQQKSLLRSFNRTCKRIAKKLGTDQRITFYTARHTSATIAYKRGAPIQEVSALLGHKDIKTTQIYLARFGANELVNTMNLL